MGARQQVAAYMVLLGALAAFWLGFDALALPILFVLFAVAFTAGAVLVVDAWRKVFGAGKQGGTGVDP
jgi:hypothetical protein